MRRIACGVAVSLSLLWAGCGDEDKNQGAGDGGTDEIEADAGGQAQSCTQVDLIIAVDGSSSMNQELEAMRTDVFPAFAARLVQVSEGIDNFRVATIDACPTPANLHTRGKAAECAFEGGNPWIDSESSAIDEEFACVGDIYQADIECSGSNDDEQPVASTIAALTDAANSAFVRENALLVVIAITDEDEQPTGSAQAAQELFDGLIQVKGGDPKRMVFLGIGGSSDCTGVYGKSEKATKLAELTDLFKAQERGVFWDLCGGRLEDGLSEAFAVIETACDELPRVN